MKKHIGLIIGLLPLVAMLLAPRAEAQLVMSGSYYVVLNGGSQSTPTSLVLTNPSPAGITNNGTGWIVSENEFNQVVWDIGTDIGNYVVPFGYSTTDYLPLICGINIAGVGGGGNLKFATYHGSSWNNTSYKPSDVTTMADFGSPDYSNNAVDRFWIVDPGSNYSTKPTMDLILTYIRGAASEIAAPNFILEYTLIAQRYNSSSSVWSDFLGTTNTDATNANTGTVNSGVVTPANFFRSWCVMNDSNQIGAGIPGINEAAYNVNVYPNPSTGNIMVSMTGADKASFEVYDVLGQQLYSHAITAGINTLNLDTKANGMYLYRIMADNGNLVSQGKLVIQK